MENQDNSLVKMADLKQDGEHIISSIKENAKKYSSRKNYKAWKKTTSNFLSENDNIVKTYIEIMKWAMTDKKFGLINDPSEKNNKEEILTFVKTIEDIKNGGSIERNKFNDTFAVSHRIDPNKHVSLIKDILLPVFLILLISVILYVSILLSAITVGNVIIILFITYVLSIAYLISFAYSITQYPRMFWLALAEKIFNMAEDYQNEKEKIKMFNKDGSLSAEFLKNRGYCCKNGCKNCPYGFKKMTPIDEK